MQVFVLDSTGSVETVIGRAGEGPGEFANPWQVHLYRDTIVMFDAGPKRISRFTLDGDLVDILTIQSTDPIWRYELTGPLDSGWVLSTTVFFPGVCTSSAMCQDSLPSLELDREGKATRSAVEAATNDMFGGLQGAGGHPFGSRSRSTVRGSDLVMGNGRALTVRVYSSVGVLKAIGRWTQVRRQVDPEDLEAFVDWRLERARTQGAPTELVEARYRGIDLPEFMPAFDQMHTDPRGWLWLEPWQPSHEERGTSWTVLGQNLEWLGTVEMPPNVNVLDIGETEVLGVWSDEFDVQFVGVWPLNR